ncbi:Hsp20-like chaperones superfamily protein [Thalictrum thalictroides]|uniref:Hsp20-like chaperones superfamily protein n=1 Tax=Thalictrum thalictroides TaxID=46969 RepID=A0A7J6WP32_THATH|nr:Hsp20-like chaperones superfamily protein [Thalictrum thalictroides]
MATKSQATSTRSYEDFEPSSNWVKEEYVDTLVIHLPGFKKEHLRVQIDNRGNLKISGERQLEDNRWSRFHMEFRASKNCNTTDITAKFVGGLLYVKFPKKSAEVLEQNQPTLVQQDNATDKMTKTEKKSEQGMSSLEGNRVITQNYGPRLRLKFFLLKWGSRLREHKGWVAGAVVTMTAVLALGIYGAYRLNNKSSLGEDAGN